MGTLERDGDHDHLRVVCTVLRCSWRWSGALGPQNCTTGDENHLHLALAWDLGPQNGTSGDENHLHLALAWAAGAKDGTSGDCMLSSSVCCLVF